MRAQGPEKRVTHRLFQVRGAGMPNLSSAQIRPFLYGSVLGWAPYPAGRGSLGPGSLSSGSVATRRLAAKKKAMKRLTSLEGRGGRVGWVGPHHKGCLPGHIKVSEWKGSRKPPGTEDVSFILVVLSLPLIFQN